jgi:hypothetical protein
MVMPDQAAIKVFQDKLQWSRAHCVKDLERSMLPDRPGIYVFTRTDTEPVSVASGVLYIGKTDGVTTSLRQRVWGYCVDNPDPSGEPHRGRRQIFEYRKRPPGDNQLFVRWTVYSDAGGIEGALIYLFEPPFNTRTELIWTDETDIEDRYIGAPYEKGFAP